MTLTVGSLFAGIGGFDLGLERAGMSVRWQVENNPYCQRVLAKHWPNVQRYGDIQSVDWGTVEPVDVLCGGFPCQDISLAGKGAGLAGERSGLWFEYAKAIEALAPRYVIIENVAALRSRGLDQVLGALAALGYDAEWHCIPASAVGAPHRRDRVWIIAYSTEPRSFSGAQPGVYSREESARSWDGESQRFCGASPSRIVADTERERSQRRGDGRAVTGSSGLCGGAGTDENESIRRAGIGWLPEPDVGRVAHGVPARVDRLRGLGNAVVPQIVEWLGRCIINAQEAQHDESRLSQTGTVLQ